jgi:hypothetical protein
MSADRKVGLGRPGSGGRRPLLTSSPKLTDNDDEGAWNESTPITDMPELFRKVGQTSSMVRQLVEGEIPALREDVKEAVDASKNAQREAFDAKTEAMLAKERIEDVRHRVECLEPVKEIEAATQVKVNGLTEKINAGSDKRRWLLGVVVGLGLSLLASAGGAIWWAAQVDASVQHESGVREQYDRSIIEKLDSRPTRDEVLMRDELKELREELTRRREPTVEEWLDSLPPSKRQAAQKLLGETDPTAVQ